jgi:hypothetical protein
VRARWNGITRLARTATQIRGLSILGRSPLSGGCSYKGREMELKAARMAASRGGSQCLECDERTHGSAEMFDDRANEPMGMAARHQNRANEPTAIGVERMAPIGAITAAWCRRVDSANRRNKATMIAMIPIRSIVSLQHLREEFSDRRNEATNIREKSIGPVGGILSSSGGPLESMETEGPRTIGWVRSGTRAQPVRRIGRGGDRSRQQEARARERRRQE